MHSRPLRPDRHRGRDAQRTVPDPERRPPGGQERASSRITFCLNAGKRSIMAVRAAPERELAIDGRGAWVSAHDGRGSAPRPASTALLSTPGAR